MKRPFLLPILACTTTLSLTVIRPSAGVLWAQAAPAKAVAVQAQPKGVPAAGEARTALDRYVAAPDASYRYDVVATIPGSGFEASVIDLTSQTWRSPTEVDRTVWKHWLTVIVPTEVRRTTAFLFISGGSNSNPAPRTVDENLARVATTTGSVVAELRMVPNQPLVFAGDGKPRTEDELIAYTWDKFLHGGDDQWPARLPMTKAAVRALDTVTSFCRSGSVTVDRFVVAGASKRGWTTWTTAAVDKRVIAIVPMVIDVLNIVPSFRHHLAVYGYYAPAVNDYEEIGITESLGTPRTRALMAIEEPYEYRQRLTMPKLMINATGDQFFLPDSWRYYYDELPGTKYLRYVPNADHSLRGSDAWLTTLAWYDAILAGKALPRFDWRVEKDGTIRVRAHDTPTAVKLWQVTNPGARDFRLSTIGAKWKATDLPPRAGGEYTARLPRPARGFTAYMVELTFPSGVAMAPFKFTTGVKVVPDVEPFKDMVPRQDP
jgi:PhoPQ-activated pathogenicity-related protein